MEVDKSIAQPRDWNYAHGVTVTLLSLGNLLSLSGLQLLPALEGLAPSDLLVWVALRVCFSKVYYTGLKSVCAQVCVHVFDMCWCVWAEYICACVYVYV